MTYSGATTFNAPSGRFGRASNPTNTARNTTYSRAGVIAINTILASYDCNNFRSVSIQCTSMGTTGVVTPEWSNDNVNWTGAQLATIAGAVVTTFNAAGLWQTPVAARYLRLRLSTATTAGTTTIATYLSEGIRPFTTQIAAAAAGTALIGDVGIQYRTNATGAASTASVQSPATPAVGTIKASTGRLLGFCLQNSSAGVRSVKLFNATAPTLGTTAAQFEIDIPANGFVAQDFGGGLAFTTAITFSVTSAKGLTDNTATGLAANDVSGFFAFA